MGSEIALAQLLEAWRKRVAKAGRTGTFSTVMRLLPLSYTDESVAKVSQEPAGADRALPQRAFVSGAHACLRPRRDRVWTRAQIIREVLYPS